MRHALGGESLRTDGGERNRQVGWLRAARRRRLIADIEDVEKKVSRKLCADFYSRVHFRYEVTSVGNRSFNREYSNCPVGILGAVGLRNRRNYQQLCCFLLANVRWSTLQLPSPCQLGLSHILLFQRSWLLRLFKTGNLVLAFLSCDWSGSRRAEIWLKAASGPPLTPGFLTNNT